MATKTIVRGWCVEFDVGSAKRPQWQADTHGTAAKVASIGVLSSRDAARKRVASLRHLHQSYGHGWITDYRVRRATVTLTVED